MKLLWDGSQNKYHQRPCLAPSDNLSHNDSGKKIHQLDSEVNIIQSRAVGIIRRRKSKTMAGKSVNCQMFNTGRFIIHLSSEAFLYSDDRGGYCRDKTSDQIKKGLTSDVPAEVSDTEDLRMPNLYVLVLTWERKSRFRLSSLEGGLFLIFLTTCLAARWANRRAFPEVRLNSLNDS